MIINLNISEQHAMVGFPGIMNADFLYVHIASILVEYAVRY